MHSNIVEQDYWLPDGQVGLQNKCGQSLLAVYIQSQLQVQSLHFLQVHGVEYYYFWYLEIRIGSPRVIVIFIDSPRSKIPLSGSPLCAVESEGCMLSTILKNQSRRTQW